MTAILMVLWNLGILYLLLPIPLYILANMYQWEQGTYLFLVNGLAIMLVGVATAIALTPLADVLYRFTLSIRKPIQREKELIEPIITRLCDQIENLPKSRKLTPKLMMQDTPYMQAAALGKSTIILTTGLLKNASEEELEGVIAHELGHLYHGDSVRLGVVFAANACGNVARKIMDIIVNIIAYIAGNSDSGDKKSFNVFQATFGLLLLPLSLICKLFIWLMDTVLGLILSIGGRRDEYRADAFSVKMNAGPGLHRYLERISDLDVRHDGFIGKYMASHPPTMARVGRLEELMNEGAGQQQQNDQPVVEHS